MSDMPKNVRLSVNLVWVSIAMSPLQLAFEPAKSEVAAQPAIFFGVLAVSAAILALLNLQIGTDRNWARWIMLVMFALSAASTLARLFQASATAGSLYVVQAGLQLAALVRIFTQPGSAYFKRPPRPEPRNAALQ